MTRVDIPASTRRKENIMPWWLPQFSCLIAPHRDIAVFTVYTILITSVEQMPISPTFYKQLFNESVFEAFLYLKFGFKKFWRNNIGAKDARKMLVKLTTGVNFINILRSLFLPISFCQKISLSELKKSCVKHFRTKNTCVKHWWNWLQEACGHFCVQDVENSQWSFYELQMFLSPSMNRQLKV